MSLWSSYILAGNVGYKLRRTGNWDLLIFIFDEKEALKVGQSGRCSMAADCYRGLPRLGFEVLDAS